MKLRRLEYLFGPWVRELDRATLRADALAGLLGALLVLPQGIAFATLAGLPPQWGLYTAIVPCVVAALFGSSRHVMSGPTNAISLARTSSARSAAEAGKAKTRRSRPRWRLILLEPFNIAGVAWEPTAGVGPRNMNTKRRRFIRESWTKQTRSAITN